MLSAFLQRLRSKLREVIPVILGSLLIAGFFSLLLWLITPLLPDSAQQLMNLLAQGDWAASRAELRAVFEQYGAAQWIIFVVVQVLQVLVAPIPGQVVGLLGGYLFGFWPGLGLTMLGLLIGSIIAIGLGRLFGLYVVRRLVPQAILGRFDYLVVRGGLWNFFMLFLLPALPDDAICLIAGLTRLPFWPLVAVCLLGRLPGMAVLSFVGSSVGSDMRVANGILVVAMLLAVAIWLYSDEVEAYVQRLSKRHES